MKVIFNKRQRFPTESHKIHGIPAAEIGFSIFFFHRSDVALRQGRRHPFPVGPGSGAADTAHLSKQHINEKQLCHPGRDGPQLQGRLIGAALKNHIGAGRRRVILLRDE